MKVHAIQTGTVAVKERQRSGTGPGPLRLPVTLADRDWTEPLPIYAWVIEHPEGVIVVDTGETARVTTPGYLPRWHPYYRLGVKEWVEPEQEIGPQLRGIGIGPDDVRWLLMTHLHTDHAGGLGHFQGAEILVTRPEFENASGTLGKLRGFLPHRWPEWFSPMLVDLETNEVVSTDLYLRTELGASVEQVENAGERLEGTRACLLLGIEAEHRLEADQADAEAVGILARPPVRADELDPGDRLELAAADVEQELDVGERLESRAESRLRLSDAFGHRAYPSAVERVEVEYAIGLAEPHGAEHDRLGLVVPPGHPASVESAREGKG
jgi:hypothetical protein